jgi:predicted NAD-dependent protein-ADP-ribosyltransferase YbiA (DUF1768 family)
MKYSKELLIEKIEKGTKFDYIFFEDPPLSGDDTFPEACFSHKWMAEFDENHNTWNMEQYMKAKKARLLNDLKSEEKAVKNLSKNIDKLQIALKK